MPDAITIGQKEEGRSSSFTFGKDMVDLLSMKLQRVQ